MANLQKQIVEVPSKATVTVQIPHLPANYFRIQNSSAVTVYCGLTHMPTKKLFEFKVPAGEARLYCEDKLYSHIYIYNDGTETADLILYTFQAPFEPTALAMTDIGGSGDGENRYLGEVDVVGFTQSLPTGNNHIGQMTVANPPKDYEPKLDEVITALGNVGGGGGNSDESLFLPTMRIGTLKPSRGSMIIMTHKASEKRPFCIHTISNDANVDLWVQISSGQATDTFILKPNESLNNVRFRISGLTLSYQDTTGTGSARWLMSCDL